MYGFIGFVIGFIVGMGVNAYLLQGKPRAALMKDRKTRLIYGGLNWGIAVLGAIIGIVVRDMR